MSTPTSEDRARRMTDLNAFCSCHGEILCPQHQHFLNSREWDFIRALIANRLDVDTFSVLADYLEENGRDDAGQRVRLLRPQTGDVLVWTFPVSGVAQTAAEWEESRDRQAGTEKAACNIQERLRGTGTETRVVVMADHYTLKTMPPEEMRRQGWVPLAEAERLRAMVREANFRHDQDAEMEELRALLQEALEEQRRFHGSTDLGRRIDAALNPPEVQP